MDADNVGYRHLADFMAWDSSLAIFPRFRSANMLCLLQMQAEITDLEQQLKALAYVDITTSDRVRKKLSFDWSVLQILGKDSDEYKIHSKLRLLLADYNRLLVNQIALQSQPSPKLADLSYLQYWIQHEKGGNGELCGPGAMSWNPMHEGGREFEDLISLDPLASNERTLTGWMIDSLWPLLHRLPRKLKPVRVFQSEAGQGTFARYGTKKTWKVLGDQISSFLATVLILIPVIVLHFVISANARLVIIVAFSLAFTALLVLTTDAKRSEIFAASAAFVAIQVIYVGSALEPASA